jgi:hypothetical protein
MAEVFSLSFSTNRAYRPSRFLCHFSKDISHEPARIRDDDDYFGDDSDDNGVSSSSEEDSLTPALERSTDMLKRVERDQQRSNRMSTPKMPKSSVKSQVFNDDSTFMVDISCLFQRCTWSANQCPSFSRMTSEKSPRSRLPSSFIRLPTPADDNQSHLYANGFDELCEWLFNELETGAMLTMTRVQCQYMSILRRRKERFFEASTRTTAIRARLETRFKDDLLFEKLNNYNGTHVVLNDLPAYVRLSISSQNSHVANRSTLPDDDPNSTDNCTSLFNAIKLIRRTITSGSHYFKHLAANRDKLTSLTSGSLWEFAPLLLKNFVGLLTMSSPEFSDFERDGAFLGMFETDMFGKSQKWLKVASISFDIINCQNERQITPKHYLLANEIFRQTRSADLLTIMNRMGHSCSYKTIARLHHEVSYFLRMLHSRFSQFVGR